MNIAIDISQAVYEGTGVARFTNGLIHSILKYDHANTWTFFYSSLRKGLSPNIQSEIEKSPHTLKHSSIPPTLLSFLWNDLHFVTFEKLIGKDCDWIITSDWTEPPASAKKATIVHDLAYIQFPDTVNSQIKRTQQTRMRHVVNESRLIFADSKTTKNDILQFLQIADNKVIVNYPGIHIEKASNDESVLKKYGIEKPFILSVGKIEPRKNLKRLMEAFDMLNLQDYELILAGPSGWESLTPKNNVKLIGYVSDYELSQLYQRCLFFVYPSLWEGFGYPVIEAMAHGTPVTTSNTSSLKEIAEGAALLFDPHEVKSIANAMTTMITDEKLRTGLGKKGLVRAEQFTWEKYLTNMLKELAVR